jgi:hypothetical protein
METDRLRLLRVEPSEPSMNGRPTTLLNVRDAGGGRAHLVDLARASLPRYDSSTARSPLLFPSPATSLARSAQTALAIRSSIRPVSILTPGPIVEDTVN